MQTWLIGNDSDAGRDGGQEEKRTTEDEMSGWHHQLDGHEFEWTPGVGDGQGGLACCDSGVPKSRTWLSDWTELSWTANEATDKKLISKIYNQVNIRKTNNQVKKWAEDPRRHFSKEDIQMAVKHILKMLTSLIVRKMQIKTITSSFDLMPIRMAIIKKSTNNKYWREEGEGNPHTLLVAM